MTRHLLCDDGRTKIRSLLLAGVGFAILAPVLVGAAPRADAAGLYVAVDDTYSTTQAATFTTSSSVLANDDLGGDALNWDAITLPMHGTASVTGVYPNFSYTPDPGFSGTDTFQYCIQRLAGGGACLSNTATVTINVAAAVPVDDFFETAVATPLVIDPTAVIANDTNAPGHFANWNATTMPANGTLSAVAGTTYQYTPRPGFVGADSFGYCLVKGGGCLTGSATIHINVGLPSTSRMSGTDRFEVAVKIADSAYPTTAPVLLIASGVNYPDALSAAPAAVKLGGPMLLTLPDRVPDGTAQKITSLKPGRIIVVGGLNSVSTGVEGQLKTLVPTATVERVGGADRYAVSRDLANLAFGTFGHAYVATGATFADALSAGAAAATAGEPVVLVNGSAQAADEATLALLRSHSTTQLTVVGGPNSVSPAVESSLASVASMARIGGADRFEASYNVNHAAFATAGTVYLATGLNFPDALAGGVLAGGSKAPLYVVPTTCVPDAVIDDIIRVGAKSVVLLGGPNSLTEDVARLTPCA